MIDRIKALQEIAQQLELDEETRKRFTDAAVAYVENYYAEAPQAPAYIVTNDQGKGIYDSPISADPIDIDQALALLHQNVDLPGVNQLAAGHMAFIPSSGLHTAALGDFLSTATNRYAGHFYGSPGAVRVENMLLRWMADIVGYPPASLGNLTSGGSMANLIGVVTAREACNLRARDYDRCVVYMSEDRHHSMDKALRIAGVGEYVPRFVAQDEHLRMDARLLAEQIVIDTRLGLRPWLIVATAGTTDAGAIDPLSDIGEIASAHDLWLHVDAAYGGFFALCEQGRPRLRGIERSHSLTMDPHKSLFMSWGSGAALVREGKALLTTFHHSADYLADTENAEEISPADLSPELTRSFRGLRLWLSLKLLGTRPFAAALDEKLLLAQYAHQQLRELDGFEVGPQPDLSIVLFRALPKRGDIDAYNAQLAGRTRADGRIFLSTTRLHGELWLRFAILGRRTHLDTIDLAIEVLREFTSDLTAPPPRSPRHP